MIAEYSLKVMFLASLRETLACTTMTASLSAVLSAVILLGQFPP